MPPERFIFLLLFPYRYLGELSAFPGEEASRTAPAPSNLVLRYLAVHKKEIATT